MTDNSVVELKRIAQQIREDVIRTARDCSEGVHVGGSLSIAEILAVLYFKVMNIDPKNPDMPDRDRFVLSKGHANAGLSAAMAQRGFFPIEQMEQFDMLNAPLSMHIDRHRMRGVEVSSGSLGHGLPIAAGMAMGGKLDKAPWKVYCIIGDGEIMEGSMWEAMMSAAHFKLSNLVVILDRNSFSLDGPTETIMSLEPLAEKIKSFGWTVVEVDGHDVEALVKAFDSIHYDGDKPTMIFAKTIKGKGIPNLENTAKAHFAHLKPEEAEKAFAAISSK
jgi:transketolase